MSFEADITQIKQLMEAPTKRIFKPAGKAEFDYREDQKKKFIKNRGTLSPNPEAGELADITWGNMNKLIKKLDALKMTVNAEVDDCQCGEESQEDGDNIVDVAGKGMHLTRRCLKCGGDIETWDD